MSQYLLAFLTALVGVVGTGIGVLAAFVPTELIGKRDYYERITKFWSLLQFEVAQIIIYCPKFHDLPTVDKESKIDTTLSPISLAAWQAALANSEFIGAVDPVPIRNLAACYVLLERLNAAVENYKLFCATANVNELPNFGVAFEDCIKRCKKKRILSNLILRVGGVTSLVRCKNMRRRQGEANG